MRAVAFTVAALLVVAGALIANAQQDSASPSPVAPPPASNASAVDMTQVCSRPDVRRMQRFYPRRALDNQVRGEAVLDCALDDQNIPASCQLVSETPLGYGFGPAAILLTCKHPPGPITTTSAAHDYQDYVVPDTGQHRKRFVVRFQTAG